MKIPIHFSKKCQHRNKSRLSEMLTVDGTWSYKFEPQRRLKNKIPNPLFSPDLSPCDFFLYTLPKNNLYRRLYEPKISLGNLIGQCLQGVAKKVYFSAFRSWILRLENEFLSR